MPESEERSDRLPAVASVLREFFVDFLSSMIPGFLFTMFSVPLVLGAGVVLFPNQFVWKSIEGEVQERHPEVVCLVLVFSYVLGCIFSRRDPKVPDQKSAALLLFRDWNDRKRAVIQEKVMNSDAKDSSQTRVAGKDPNWIDRWLNVKRLSSGPGGQFPYSHLYEYLTARKLNHLAAHVPWRGTDKSIDARSKMFINILKIRLHFHNQRRCGEIVRNEAHVRMMSSMWFAAKELEWVFGILLILTATVSLWQKVWVQLPYPTGRMMLGAMLVLLLIATQWLSWSILKFLHYQRVREIVYVLETAHTAWMSGQKDIFGGLERYEGSAN
jgi:hypothetical protein